MRTRPQQHKRTENIANLRKAGVGMIEIGRPKTQNQKTRKQTNEKQSRRRESNPTDDSKFRRRRSKWKHTKSFRRKTEAETREESLGNTKELKKVPISEKLVLA
jgi:hypothetical protein